LRKITLKDGLGVDIQISAGDYAIDCGANIGDVTDLFQSLGAHVIAFEPNEHAFKVLNKRFQNNARVVCIQKGVSGKNDCGTRKMFLHEKAEENQLTYSTGCSLLEDKNNVNRENFIHAEVIDFCSFLNSFDVSVKVLKIDIEGAEVNLMNDLLDEGLLREIPYVFVETHERKIPSLVESTQKLKQRIKKENYHNINLDWR